MATKRKTRRKNIWPFGAGQPLGSRSYLYRVDDAPRKGSRQHLPKTKRSAAGGSARSTTYKGYRIVARREGFVIPKIDRDSIFDTKRDAQRFINDSVKWARKNPGLLDILSLAQMTGALKGSPKKAPRKNPAWIKSKAVRIRRSGKKLYLDIYR